MLSGAPSLLRPAFHSHHQSFSKPFSLSFCLSPVFLSLNVLTERQQEQSPKDESDAATLRQTLPDLTPDEPSDAAVSSLPAEETAPSQPDPTPAHTDGEELVAADDATGDAGSDESPNKSPSKKKKKFRTPSFLKKNKKKSES